MTKIFIFLQGENFRVSLKKITNAGFEGFSYLALGKLSHNEVELLRVKNGKKIIKNFTEEEKDSFLKEYLNIVGQLNCQQDGPFWWATDISSKNRFMSPLGALLEKFWIASQVIKENKGECLVILGVPWPIFSSVSQLADASFQENKFFAFSYGFVFQAKTFIRRIGSLVWNVYQTTLRMFLARKFFGDCLKKDFVSTENHAILKSFVYQGSFSSSGDFQDPYFGDLPQILKKKYSLIILGTALVDYDECLKKMKQCPSVFMVPWELFLSWQDPWIWSLRYLFYRPSLGQPIMFCQKDVRDILRKEFLVSGPKIQLAQLFHYPAVERLARKMKISRWIMTNENNPWERMSLRAIKTHSPATQTLGYVQSVVPQASANMFLSPVEKDVTPLPDQILTTGEEPKLIMERYGDYAPNRIKAACGLRFQYLFEKPLNPRHQPVKKVLLALEGIPEVSSMVDYVFKELKDEPFFEVIIRTHPVLPWTYFEKKHGYGLKEMKNIHLSKDTSLSQDILSCDVVMYWGTTVALEALSIGKPVVHFDNGALLSFDPLFRCHAIKWTVDAEQSLKAKLSEIDSLSDEDFTRGQQEARNYLRDYFAPITEQSLNRFVNEPLR